MVRAEEQGSYAHDSKRAPPDFKLVGYANFVRSNPRSDRFPVRRFHHVEFWSTDATNVARRFSFGLGIPLVGKSDFSTGNPVHASYLLRSADLSILFSAPYSPTLISAHQSSPRNYNFIPSFSFQTFQKFVSSHGLAVRAVAVEVADAESAFHISVSNGAIPAHPPTAMLGPTGGEEAKLAEVSLYGDVVLRYVSFHGPPRGGSDEFFFLPGFEPVESDPIDYGLQRLDHAVGNVPDLASAIGYVKRFTGFHEFAEFTSQDVGTAESGLNSAVLANNEETVLIPMNEPIQGTKRRSQIQTYLDHNEGPGVQHLAIGSVDIFRTLREMRARSGVGGFEFMPAPPPTYYRDLVKRIGEGVLTEEELRDCEKLGILVDRDAEGVLLQIFTKPIGDRPTIFLEIIQRIGCIESDDKGNSFQKGGCGGFGKGNFAALFKSIEEYEKMLDSKITSVQVADIMTKPLKLEQFLSLQSMLRMIEASERQDMEKNNNERSNKGMESKGMIKKGNFSNHAVVVSSVAPWSDINPSPTFSSLMLRRENGCVRARFQRTSLKAHSRLRHHCLPINLHTFVQKMPSNFPLCF